MLDTKTTIECVYVKLVTSPLRREINEGIYEREDNKSWLLLIRVQVLVRRRSEPRRAGGVGGVVIPGAVGRK